MPKNKYHLADANISRLGSASFVVATAFACGGNTLPEDLADPVVNVFKALMPDRSAERVCLAKP